MKKNKIINECGIDENPVSSELTTNDDITLSTTDDIIPVDPCVDGACGDCCDTTLSQEPCQCQNAPAECSPVTVGNFFGTLQESVTIAWRFHLKTRKHHIHVALNEFYYGALGIVDNIIEAYQGVNGVVDEVFTNCIVGDGRTEAQYLGDLREFINTNKHILGDCSEINSEIDNLLSLIDSTTYKLTAFNEHFVKSFDEFCYENLNESCCGGKCDDNDEEIEENFEEEEE